MNTQINKKQSVVLKDIIQIGGRIDIAEKNLDKRTIRALETRGLVKISENKKGAFVAATAKGKKFLN